MASYFDNHDVDPEAIELDRRIRAYMVHHAVDYSEAFSAIADGGTADDELGDAIAYCAEYGLLKGESMTFDQAAAHPLVLALAAGEPVIMCGCDLEPVA